MPANSQTHDSNDTIELTAFKKFGDDVLSKVITKGPDGKPVSDGSACRMGAGRALRRRLKRQFKPLAEFLDKCESNVAIAIGVLNDGVHGDIVEIRSSKQLAQFYCPGAVSRSLKFFCFRRGVPAFFLLDFDKKGMPPEVQAKLDELAKTLSPEEQERYGKKAGFIAAIRSLIEGFDDLGLVLRDSTSAGIYDAETGEEFEGSGGAHLYLMLKDGADAPRAIRALADRAWLAGLGWYWISKGGACLRRTIVDITVASPERLVFEGKAVVIKPLAQHDRPCDCREGEMLDSAVALPDIGKNQRAQLTALEEAAKRALKPELEKVCKRVIEERVKKAVDRGEDPARARASIERMFSGEQVTLYPPVVLTFDDPKLGEATVGEVLANPKKYVGETLADPIEPNGEGDHLLPNKALLFCGETSDLLIATCIHGGAIYRLRADYDSISDCLSRLDKKNKDDKRRAVKTLIDMLLMGGSDSPVQKDEESLLIKEARDISGVGVRDIVAMLKKARDERDKAVRGMRDAGTSWPGDAGDTVDGDPRPVIELKKGNRGDVVDLIEEAVIVSQQGVYQRGGSLVVPEFVWVSNDGKTLPPTLRTLNEAALSEVIENAARLGARNKDGVLVQVDCPEMYPKAWLARAHKRVPIISAIVNTPLVFPNGDIIDQAGYDQKTGILFDMRGVLFPPVPREPTVDDARRALETLWKPFSLYRFADDMVAPDGSVISPDVSKAVVLSALLSAILRPTLPTVPGHGVSAPTYAAGKSKLLEAISVAATGVVVSPINQNQRPEEFEKCISSAMLEAQSIISIDNVDRVLESTLLAQALTGSSVKIRVMGGNTMRVVNNVYSVFANGKNLRLAKDMLRRWVIAFVATEENPETRQFSFDPVQLMRETRPEVVSAALTLVRAFQLAPDGKVLSRLNSFDEWSDFIRSAIYWIMGSDCVDSQALARADDTEANDLMDFMEHLLAAFGTQSFIVSQVVEIASNPPVMPANVGGSGGLKFDLAQSVPEEARVALRTLLGQRFAGYRGEINSHRLGNYLAQVKNRSLNGRRVVSCGAPTGALTSGAST